MIFRLTTIVILISIISFGVYKVIQYENYKNEVIKVQIRLINNCKLYDKAFMVKSLPSGKIGRFKDGKSVMFLKRSSKIKLEASDEFPGFHFTSIPVQVNYKTDLIADCSKSDRLDNIFDSLNKQFKKNSN